MRNFELIIAHFVEHAQELSIALALGVLCFVLLWAFFKVFAKKFKHSHAPTIKFFGDVFERVNILFIVITSIYFTVWLSPMPDKISNYAKVIFMVAFWIQVATIILTLVALWLNAKRQSDTCGENLTMYNAVGIFLKLATVVICILLILQTLGFNVSTLVAGLGIGGIAVALAAQNILGDLFASISILFDKPFAVGDNILAGDIKGVVEQIGLKTTTLRAENGEQIICTNSALLKNTIRNYKRMNDRRVILTLGIVYELPQAKIESVPFILEKIISGIENCKFERAHLKNLGDSALNYEISYLITSADFAIYMNAQQNVNFEILRVFGNEKIGFAYPTQTVYNYSS